ncbi:integrase domain-containing protein, partial [Pseudomonas viridiflava]|uniref:integrase domain-containing protein n=1 Tax=Pseudomonas viridiflava TaxID=33069 RepID=UPI00197F07C9
DQYVKIPSPSKALGLQRSSVRSEAPQGHDRAQVELIARALSDRQQSRVSAIVLLARETGMRLREAILADLPRLQREVRQLGKINIQDGTKGGRSGASAPRWITVTDQI